MPGEAEGAAVQTQAARPILMRAVSARIIDQSPWGLGDEPDVPHSECRLFEVKADRLMVFTKQLAACGAAATAGSGALAVAGEPRPREDLQAPRLPVRADPGFRHT
jgi:hypothetical protein